MQLYKIYGFLEKIETRNQLGQIYKKIMYKFYNIYINLFFPLYYLIPKNQYGLDDKSNIIISLTTYPARIDTLWIVIETLLRQSRKPKKIILWLARSQFSEISDLPKKLTNLQKRGLTISFCEDLKSHKKYYYAYKKYGKKFSIITVDDDVFYPENLVDHLYKKSKQFPNIICCNWYHTIKVDRNGAICSYDEWTNFDADCSRPSYRILPVGIGGVLYPPNSFTDTLFDQSLINRLCPNGDDLWLKSMAILNNVEAVPVKKKPVLFFSIATTQKTALHKSNCGEGKNDEQFKNILKKFPQVANKIVNCQ